MYVTVILSLFFLPELRLKIIIFFPFKLSAKKRKKVKNRAFMSPKNVVNLDYCRRFNRD